MCVVSMIMDHYNDEWRRRRSTYPGNGDPLPLHLEPRVTDAEIEEFRQLLERAREYDKKHNEPDCELQEKKDKLLKLAEELNIKITFL